MAFDHLEDKLDVEKLEDYFEVFSGISEPFHSTFKYMLDIASVLDEVDLKKEYAVYGGYGVLTHLAHKFGERIIPTWRGSKDIDIVGTERVKSAIKSFYNIQPESYNHNIGDKKALHIIGGEGEFKVDFSLKDLKELSKYREEKNLFGIPISVMRCYDGIGGKLHISQDDTVSEDTRLKHKIDILTLLGIVQNDEKAFSEVVKNLDGHGRYNLLKVLETGKGVTENMRMSFGPQLEFRRLLIKYLRQHKAD